MKGYHIAVVGATGATGAELLRVLERRAFPVAGLRVIGSPRSAGKSVSFHGESVPVEQLGESSFRNIDLAFFCAGSEVSRHFVPVACQNDAIVIDKSSAFRMEPHVPLVVPEINADDLKRHRGVVANPNCTTIIMLMALHPLHRAFGVRRVFATSFQAVSGSGVRGVEELKRQSQTENPPPPSFIRTRLPSICCRMSIHFSKTVTQKRKAKCRMKRARSCICLGCAFRQHVCACRFTAPIPSP